MSDNVNFEQYIAIERQRIVAKQREITERQRVFDEEANQQLANLGRELAAVAAYEAAKTGKATQLARRSAVTRTPRGSLREEIMRALSALGGGTRGQLLGHLGAKGDKSRESSISNALTTLHNTGQIVRQNDGRWKIVYDDGLQKAAE